MPSMPGYFFHVKIELPSKAAVDSAVAGTTTLSPFPGALSPFANARQTSGQLKPQKKIQRAVQSHTLKDLDTGLFSDAPEPPSSSPQDHRYDHIYIESADMTSQSTQKNDNIVGKGIGSDMSGRHMKAKYEPVHLEASKAEWGIVHLYRDTEETPGLYKDSPLHLSDLWSDTARRKSEKPHPPPQDEDCTSLCILAVPSYMTPSDFLAFVGEDTRRSVTHFRMIRTERANRYMVLMKFKHGKIAKAWQQEWNGKIFNPMEPETCHVIFLKSVELFNASAGVQNGTAAPNDGSSFPRMTDDPFVPTMATSKPLAPRTPSLVELPTCPVCLERMDETTGLLTIPCQHVFHCTCLQKWSGGGCPVCRFTNDDFTSGAGSYKRKNKISGEYEVDEKPLACETCHEDKELWQCLICGVVGCGRYKAKHSYSHFEETGHTFSMDLDSKRVWDYVGDSYVHRIIQDAAKPGEKLVELPGRGQETTALEGQEDIDMTKMQNVALEYTHLLTSQLESQRVYFEEKLEQAADKASKASKQAEQTAVECEEARDRLQVVEQHDLVAKGTVNQLEKESTRLDIRSKRLEQMLKDTNSKFLDEQKLSKGLMERNKHLETSQAEKYEKKIRGLEEDLATHKLLLEGQTEQLRDAMIQASAAQQLQDMVQRGEVDQEELEGAEVTIGGRPLTARERIKKNLADAKSARSAEQKAVPELSGSHAETPNAASGDAVEQLLAAMRSITGSDQLRLKSGVDEKAIKDLSQTLQSSMLATGVLEVAEAAGSPDAIDTGAEEISKTVSKKVKGKGKTKK